MFLRNNGVINESHRANQIWEIHCDARYFFGTIATSVELHNYTAPKADLESIHTLIGAKIALDLQDVTVQLYTPTQTKTGPGVPGAPGVKNRKATQHQRI